VTYDAAIIGAGADGLAAAILLARAGRRVVLLERGRAAGGRCITREFHPGFHASPFCDTLPAVPASIAGLLGLAPPQGLRPASFLNTAIEKRREALLARILAEAAAPMPSGWLSRLKARLLPADVPRAGWPGSDWADCTAQEIAGAAAWRIGSDPLLKGSALELLAGPPMAPRQGLGAFGARLARMAAAAGAQMRLGQEVTEIRLKDGAAQEVLLADGSRIAVGAVISTLDFKRSVMALFRWDALPPRLLAEAGAWRMGPPAARLLLALARPPVLERPLFVPGDGDARPALRRGCIPKAPALLLDPVSRTAPGSAPAGAGVLTVTVPGVPFLLFDGAWTAARRQQLAVTALRRIEKILPGTFDAVAGLAILAPPDIEDQLGVTGGDLWGGALTPDQMLGWRPGPRLGSPGDCVRHVYLAGMGSAAGPLGACASGVAAAVALMADQA
jgi:phytoene dehydrogenase-like protein